MIKTTIIKTDEYANYLLQDTYGKIYDVNINFMGIEKPKVGATIYLNKNVLDENVSLNYGLIIEEELKEESELIVLNKDEKRLYLQRFYG